MKKLLLIAILVAGCTPTNPEAWMESEENACLPTAIAFRQGLQRQGVWAEVFKYRFTDENNKSHGHAMTAYMYPVGKNQLWTYDSMGSYRTRAFTNDIASVARQAHYERWFSKSTYLAEWIK